MAKRGSGFVMISSLILILFFFYYFKFKFPDQNTVVATIDEQKITLWQLKEFSRNLYGVHDESRNKEVLELMINNEVLIIHANKSGITKNILQPQFEKQYKYAQNRLMLEVFFEIDADKNLSINRNEIREYYNTQPLFILKSINFLYSDSDAKDKSYIASRELKRLQNFEEVYHKFFPARKFIKPGLVGIVNFYELPVFLQPLATQLTKTGQATNPVENEFAYTVYYRDEKPSFSVSRDFIVKELTRQKIEDHKQKVHSDIMRNNRINLFAVDRVFNQKFLMSTNDVLASNRLTDDTLTEAELSQQLADLYSVYSITNLSKQELIDYIGLLMGQKTIFSLAREKNYFNHHKFLSRWEREKINLQEKQSQEIVDYMLEKFFNENIKDIPEAELIKFYERDLDKYRRSDLFRLQTVITNDRHTANRAFNEALANPDFDAIVMKYSNDQFVRYTKGIGPFVNRNDLGKSYDVLIRSKVGGIIQPVEIEVGIYHVYKVIDRVQGAVRPFSEVKSQVTTQLMYEKMQHYIKELIRVHKISVKRFEDKLKPAEERQIFKVFDWDPLKRAKR